MTATAPLSVATLDELAVEFERALSAYREAGSAADATPADGEAGRSADQACADASSLTCQIAELPAQTMAHVRLKARALAWHAFPDGQEPSTSDERLAFQLVRAILNGLPGTTL